MADEIFQQLEMFELMGYEGIPFETDIKNKAILEKLEMAYGFGVDRRDEEQHQSKPEDAVEKVFTDEETERDLKLYLSPSTPFVVKHLVDDNPINGHSLAPNDIKNEFEAMRDKIVSGDRTYLYDALLSQMGQMQQMSIKVNNNLASQKNIDVVIKYASMQMKLMAEQRRTIQALDDLMNPKRTTFVKEVSQHNHFPEKKGELTNEKSQEVIDAHQYTEAETVAK